MAMDAAINVPPPRPLARSEDEGGDDLADKIYELLTGKLDPADIEALLELIMGGAPQAPSFSPHRIAGAAWHTTSGGCDLPGAVRSSLSLGAGQPYPA